MFPAFCYYKQCHSEHISAALLVHTNRNARGLYTWEELLCQMHYTASPESIISISPTCSYTFHTSPSILSSSVFSTLLQYIGFANLVGMKWYLLILICISLISNEKEHLCMCLWAISYFLFSEMLILSLAQFFSVWFVFLFLICCRSLDIKPLSVMLKI